LNNGAVTAAREPGELTAAMATVGLLLVGEREGA